MKSPCLRPLLLVLIFLLVLPVKNADAATDQLENRVNTLLSKLTLDEKLGLICGTGFGIRDVPRLGIPAVEMVDGPRGVRGGTNGTMGNATEMPDNIAMAASWDTDLLQRIGQVLGTETLNKGTGAHIILGPCVNIQRSPLGGRSGEGLGEDPYLAGKIAVAYIKGVQETGAIACVKHFACNNEEVDRGYVNVHVDERALQEIYLPAFRISVQDGGVYTLMTAYNKINGHYATANKYLDTYVLHDQWGFDGLNMSDWGAVHETAGAVNAGCNLEMPGGDFYTKEKLMRDINAGSINQAAIDDSVKRILRTIIRSGVLDTKFIPDHSKVDSEENRKVAYDAACEGIVLLKNINNVLPINKDKIRSIAVIGPIAKRVPSGIGGSSYVAASKVISPLEGLKNITPGSISLDYVPGISGFGSTGLTDTIPSNVLSTDDGRQGLKAEYFDNMELKGAPSITRIDKKIDFDWSERSPGPSIPDQNYSARWSGILTPKQTGDVIIGAYADDGCRIYIDNKIAVDHWEADAGNIAHYATLKLTAGQPYHFRVEYFQAQGNAKIRLAWIENAEVYKKRLLNDAVEKAAHSDIAIVCVGVTSDEEGEGHDRQSMQLPYDQDDLVNAITAVNKKTIVVVTGSTPSLMTSWVDKVPSVIQSWNAGEEAGNALASIIYGAINPSGKLPITIAARREDYPDYGNFPGVNGQVYYKEGIYVGYRHFDKENIKPLFPFGYGLSYTSFQITPIKESALEINGNKPAVIKVSVKNIGNRYGQEVVQLYLTDPHKVIDRPVRELKGFQKVALKPGEAKVLYFIVNASDLAFCDVKGKCWRADKGEYNVGIGTSSRDIKLNLNIHLTDNFKKPIPKLGMWDVVDENDGLASFKPVTASSVQDKLYKAEYAVDNNAETRWSSQFSDPQWLVVDLGKVQTIGCIKISWENAYASAYSIQTSSDSINWETVYRNEKGLGGIENIKIDPVQARYVRLYCEKRATNFGYSVYSFGIYPPGK